MASHIPSYEQVIEETLLVLHEWCRKPVDDLKNDDDLEKLRPGKKRLLGLMLWEAFEEKYAPIFDEIAFSEIWSKGKIRTVIHVWWAVQLSFKEVGTSP
ncbi:hypothetical protein IB223_14585 [Pseudoxanthomonas sp. PXM03]|uniref:hypothetical protein n=1 Tax=Pseudoxanthomonas sp. PXM03 TaxID=2769284 RepID=UPI00178387B2|nr:hypothetical protein [Pseudoxanthomonas sp. PXM03]MBD9437327.1 hypothetical protein [Pseudoxanthomonas sp. PXM03]